MTQDALPHLRRQWQRRRCDLLLLLRVWLRL
eukprot:COSAG06_NODE_51427_length_312_cov_0.802817_1_plen_30_part_10